MLTTWAVENLTPDERAALGKILQDPSLVFASDVTPEMVSSIVKALVE